MVTERIEQRILVVRGKKVILDRDLAELYGVPTKRLNEQVKRNPARFPDDFMFRLTRREVNEVVAICDHLQELKFSHSMPYAFTEQGVAMLSSVLNSDRAIAVNIHIMRVFTRLRELMLRHKDIEQRIDDLEKRYDRKFKNIFEAIRQLLKPPLPPPKPKIPIGFHAFQKTGERTKNHETKH
ncbi:MAG: ORF6N domain-containing protein [Candidatus Omnitrophica bacterium]|nr:ORF6N domain-containing protein [Candidatus Omnitrophota bacterium]